MTNIQNLTHLTVRELIEKTGITADSLQKLITGGNPVLATGNPLLCDFYHLTMAKGWFDSPQFNQLKTSEVFFRKNPFGGGYLICAGLGLFLEYVKNWRFTDKHLDLLRQEKDIDGNPRFSEDFLQTIKNTPLSVNIKAVPEGELLFPNEPAIQITGPCWQVDLLEAIALNIFNSQSLIATKASRIIHASRLDGKTRPVLEMGFRREQEIGGYFTTRAAYIGGCTATSHVAGAYHFNIPKEGTMAHSFIMSFDSELEAFKTYLKAHPHNGSLLVDTYDIKQGILNAIQASKETGIPLKAIRIDSGDLGYWYKKARQMFDKADMPHVKLIASNDLDEHIIADLLLNQHASYDIFGVGTKLVTAYDQPSLGGVFKTKSINGVDKMKVAEGKTTIPGATDVIRLMEDGKYAGDIIADVNSVQLENNQLTTDIVSVRDVNPQSPRRRFKKGTQAYTLLEPVVINGQVQEKHLNRPLTDIQQATFTHLSLLDDSHKRFLNPHIYGVGIAQPLYSKQQSIIAQYQQRTALLQRS